MTGPRGPSALPTVSAMDAFQRAVTRRATIQPLYGIFAIRRSSISLSTPLRWPRPSVHRPPRSWGLEPVARAVSEPIPGLLLPREAGGTPDGSHFPSFRAPACRVIALVESSSSRAIGDPGPFEVWIADQSDTRPGFGGQLLIYRGADLMGGRPGGPSRSSGSIWVAPPPTCAVRPRDRRPCERQDACSFRFSRADDSHYRRGGR